MAWDWIAAAETPPSEGSTDSVTVALITALSTVAVALLVLAGQWLNSRGNRTSASPPDATVHIGERVVAAEIRTADNARTLDVLDRHVDGIDDRVDKLQWQMDDFRAWRDGHQRKHD